ncbi:MAG: Crp/Fnr family transcriptional regulator [Bacteroidota bacterium]|nr:Crp/Fnr family transcriptional regulator [Bacteroidota bacterium]
MEELIFFLNSIHPLSKDTSDFLMSRLQFVEISKKSFVLREGDVCREIYFVTKGLLRCFYKKNEKDVSAWFMKEGDVVISVESFLKQTKSKENIQALEDCSLYYINYDELQLAYSNFSDFNSIDRILTEKYYLLSEQRLYSLRMQRASEKYLFLLNHFPQILLRVPLKYIASYLGITEETLSRIRAMKILIDNYQELHKVLVI